MQKNFKETVTSATAMELVESGNRVYIHAAAAAPQILVDALIKESKRLKGVKIYHLHTDSTADYIKPEYDGIFEVYSLFIGANVRRGVQEGRVNFIPAFLSEIPGMFRNGIIPVDVCFIQVSPPDKHGFCSLGTSVEATRAAMEVSKYVIAQVNRAMPRTHGDSLIHMDHIDAMVEGDMALHETILPTPTEIEIQIGKNAASLIEDKSTLQMGIGNIPNAVLTQLTGHKGLGIHTEMFSDGIIPLVETGVITNEHKKIIPGKIVSGFVIGSRKLYDFIDDNPMVNMMDIAFVNDVSVIKQNKRAVSINSAIEVDVTGQVCADSIGARFYSGVGGQMDFIRGASLSTKGKPIIALPSETLKGKSKIVPVLTLGAGVVTTRAHVHYVITEYGVADLYGKSIRERIKAMIEIAHPNHRDMLQRQAFEIYRF
ncbi:MAG: acetyl-CoA hydrolase/transferase family protein [Bacteroidia bacterium]